VRKLILVYIALRYVIVSFYDVYIAGFKVTEFVGLAFPLVLLMYYFSQTFRGPVNKLHRRMLLMVSWLLFSSLIVFLNYNFSPYVIFRQFFAFFTGIAVALAFPLLFNNEKRINHLLNAFLISTIYPAIQMLGQFAGILDLNKELVEGEFYMFEGVYGNHGVFGLISWIGAVTVMMKAKYWINHKRRKIWFIGLFLLFLSIGFLTLSRTIVVIMVILFIFFSIYYLRKSSIYTKAVFGILLFVFTTSSLFQYAKEGLLVRSEDELEVLEGSRGIEAGFHGRIGRWDQNLSYFLNDFNLVEQLIGTNLFIGPHGDYFCWLFSYGYIGLFLYLGLLIFILNHILRYIKYFKNTSFFNYYSRALLAAFFAWIIMAVATNPSFIPDFSVFTVGHFSILYSYARRHQYAQIQNHLPGQAAATLHRSSHSSTAHT
jgi:hypothetical protein